MIGLFQEILRMSVTGSFVILFVLVARLLLKKAPKIYSYMLWALVLFRLLCPVTLSSGFSLIPREVAGVESMETVELHHTEITTETVWEELPYETQYRLDRLTAMVTKPQETPEQPVEKGKEVLSGWEIAGGIWLGGVVLLLLYSIFSLAKIYRKVEISLQKEGNVYIAEDIDTPFTLGLFAPKIYLPTGLMEKEAGYIIAHEKRHIKRLDHIIKIVAFLTVCIHWFNPLVWLAFILAGKDMEMSCDEAVMKEFTEDIRQEYSGSLLNLATGRRVIAMAPLAFGEGNVKERIKNVMNYKKPVFWISVLAVGLCVVLALCLLTNPKEEDALSESIVATQPTVAPTFTEAPTVTLAPTKAPVAEDGEMVEKEISVFYADLTGDDISERVVLSVDVFPEDANTSELITLLRSAYLAKVSVYKGLGGDFYEEEALWSLGDISTSRPGNYQVSLLEVEEKHYLLISALHEQQGEANYWYQVLSLTENGEEQIADEYSVSFKFAESEDEASWLSSDLPIRSEVVPDFQEHLSKWYDENGILLIAADVNLWDGDMEWVEYSTSESPVWYMKYYGSVFSRQDYYTLAGKTMFTTKYFTLDLPREWTGKVHIEEHEDGKSVWVYHTKTSELEYGFGLLGTISLVEQEFAAELMEAVPAIYIGKSYVLDGVTYVPMACEPTDVQTVEETAAEHAEMSTYFADGRIAKHAWVTENGPYGDALWELAYYKEMYPQYGLMWTRAAVVGQKLLWQESAQETVLFDTDGENHTLIIGDMVYSHMLEDAFYIEDGSATTTWYAVVDFDTEDESREIIVYDDGPSGDPGLHVIQLTGAKLKYMGRIGTLGFMSSFRIHGDGTVTVLERTWSPENNVVEKTYMMQDSGFEELPREEYVYLYRDFHKVIQNLEVYTERDLSANTVVLSAGEEQICFNKVFSSSEEGECFYEIETLDGEIYYLYSDGNLDDFVADLSHAG
ncbi:MAG: hypothetical protein IJZ82_03705 [Lachnospiraceae bacterium]|nr:hypothetical protein [Lachnospiraceae bacterium]